MLPGHGHVAQSKDFALFTPLSPLPPLPFQGEGEYPARFPFSRVVGEGARGWGEPGGGG